MSQSKKEHHLDEALAMRFRPLRDAGTAAEIFEQVFWLDVKLGPFDEHGVGGSLFVTRNEALKLHSASLFLSGDPERASLSFRLLVDDLVLHDDDAPLCNVLDGVIENLLDRSVNLDARKKPPRTGPDFTTLLV